MSGQHILVVDDDADTLKLVGMILEGQGYSVSKAATGEEALEAASSRVPDLVILDVMLPDMDGYSIARQLRNDSATADVPIVMFTAKGKLEDKAEGYEAGVDDYVAKPAHPADLLSRIRSVMAGRTLEGDIDEPVEDLVIVCLSVNVPSVAEGCAAALAERGLQVVYAPIEDPDAAPPSVGGIHWRPVDSLAPDEVAQFIQFHGQQHDSLVLDLAQGLDETGIACVQQATWTLIATTTTRESLAATDRISKALHQAGVNPAQTCVVLVPPDGDSSGLKLDVIQSGLGVGEIAVLEGPASYETLAGIVIQQP